MPMPDPNDLDKKEGQQVVSGFWGVILNTVVLVLSWLLAAVVVAALAVYTLITALRGK